MRLTLPLAILAVVATTGQGFAASAIQKECAAKYRAAKDGGTLNGMDYKQFYSQCASQARGETPASTKTAEPTPATAPAAAAERAASTTRAPTATGNAVFPTAISAQYSSLKPGAARRKTCDDQYRLNKASNGNGGLKWTEKGGGYYSECVKRLKG